MIELTIKVIITWNQLKLVANSHLFIGSLKFSIFSKINNKLYLKKELEWISKHCHSSA